MAQTFYWYDFETWGTDPARDRPCQFAGLRTDENFTEIGEPLTLFCRPPTDCFPHPQAALVTGITPQYALTHGLCEAEFAKRIHAELSEPETCSVGYNSMRFDDEVTRYLLYRNLYDPYAREWQNGNSRWDLIDTLRLAHALRPEGIEWPLTDAGVPSFRLEVLTAANGIAHQDAHDALADVRATIAMAKLIRNAQPRLLDYVLKLRDKNAARAMLRYGTPVLHVSARFPATLGCIAPIAPLAGYPGNKNAIICFDLRSDPEVLLSLTSEQIRRRVFVPVAELATDETRLPLKAVHLNRAPVLVPMNTLTPQAAEQWQINQEQVAKHAAVLHGHQSDFAELLGEVFNRQGAVPTETTDPDLMLYSGPFFSDADRRTCADIRNMTPETLASFKPRFEDERLPEMFFRYRARNWPETLSPEERADWNQWRFERLSEPKLATGLVYEDYMSEIEQLAEAHATQPEKVEILATLSMWGDQIMDADL